MTSISRPSGAPVHASILALALLIGLSGCARLPADSSDATARSGAVAAQPETGELRRDIAPGLYELTTAGDRVYVTTTGVKRGRQLPGEVLELNGQTLAVERRLALPLAPFSLAYDASRRTLYAGHTFDGAVSAIALDGSAPTRSLALSTTQEKSHDNRTRKVLVDSAGQRLFVSSPGTQGHVWIVDANSGRILHTVALSKWPAGLAYDAARNRLYVGHGGTVALSVIDPDRGVVLQQFPAAPQERFLVNLSLDAGGERLFAADANSGDLLVFDSLRGTLLKRIPISMGLLDVVYDARRDRIYVSNRGASPKNPEAVGQVTVIDGRDYRIVHRHTLNPNPNSLALDARNDNLYVSVKGQTPDGVESVVRIALP